VLSAAAKEACSVYQPCSPCLRSLSDPGLLPPAAAAAAAAAGPAVAAVVAAMRVQTREMICFGAENVCV